MAKLDNQDIMTPYRAQNDKNVILQNYLDDRFGFLRLEISRDIVDILVYTVPRPQEPWRTPSRLFDRIRFDWRNRKILMQNGS
jgi:acid phosphatase type 7